MTIPLISIGKSKGILLSKSVLKKYNIKDSIELICEKDFIILKPKQAVRKGWDKAFKKMHVRGDDKLLIDSFFEDENWAASDAFD